MLFSPFGLTILYHRPEQKSMIAIKLS
jgi:hypothetical protein